MQTLQLRKLIPPLALFSFVTLQVVLIWWLRSNFAHSSQHQVGNPERSLEQEIEHLGTSSAHLKNLHVRLKSKLEVDQEPKAIQRASDLEHQVTGVQDVGFDGKVEKGDAKALQGRVSRIADLAESFAIQNQAAAEKAAKLSEHDDSAMLTSQGMSFPSGHEDGECVGSFQKEAEGAVAAVVTVTFDRADYLRRHLDSLLAVHSKDADNKRKFPLHVSQDGKKPKAAVAEVAKAYAGRGVRYLHHREEEPPKRLLSPKENLAYYRIANHYKFIFKTFFDCFGYTRLIILEDDMELAPDFFSYFEATSKLLTSDPSLFCISSWNDHGQEQFVRSETQLLRSDFFPGLGWMLGRDFWAEVRQEWPKAYWDDWMRLNKVRKGRQCIRPEVCRTYNFGAKGSSKGLYFRRYLKPIKLNSVELDWTKLDLSYLEQSRYDSELDRRLAAASLQASFHELATVQGDAVLQYDSQKHYEKIAARFGMLSEWKDGVPRGGYRNVVTIRWHNQTVFLAPSAAFVQAAKRSARLGATGAVIRNKELPRKFVNTVKLRL